MFLNCYYAGTIINRSDELSEETNTFFPLNEFISIFKDEDRSGELVDGKYLVLCSCKHDEECVYFSSSGISSGYALANKWWMLGGGWNSDYNTIHPLAADGNNDSIVSLSELYTYSHYQVLNNINNYNSTHTNYQIAEQNIVVYPTDSDFTIFARTYEEGN